MISLPGKFKNGPYITTHAHHGRQPFTHSHTHTHTHTPALMRKTDTSRRQTDRQTHTHTHAHTHTHLGIGAEEGGKCLSTRRGVAVVEPRLLKQRARRAVCVCVSHIVERTRACKATHPHARTHTHCTPCSPRTPSVNLSTPPGLRCRQRRRRLPRRLRLRRIHRRHWRAV